MKTIQPFIDLGWYTVPLEGKLERLEGGKKTTPLYPKNWKQKYQEQFNEKATALGGTITGAISGIIAIDCDNEHTRDLFLALDPTHSFAFVSDGKVGTTLIYRYTQDLATTFSIQNGELALDFYSDNGFVYLPTDANKTKQHWPQESMEELPKIPELPPTTLALLKQLLVSTQKQFQETEKTPMPVTANYLAPQVAMFVQKKQFIPGLFRIITPKDFRELEQYAKFGYLHPDNVPDGRGSEYISKISAILGRDSSIDEELYRQAMHQINELWAEPMQKKRLEDTIIKPMVSGGASIDGTPIWQYDKHWDKHGLVVSTKRGESLEVFFDDHRAEFFTVNLLQEQVKGFQRDSDLANYLETVSLDSPSRKDLKTVMPLVHIENNPANTFGFYERDEYTRAFNRFQQTRGLALLRNPAPYKSSYAFPKYTINYLRSFIPDDDIRNYLLRFLKRKLLRFEYSPVLIYFLGKPGSGKDTFVKIIERIISSDCVARPSTREFLEMYNGWLVDKYFVQLDEYGDQLSKQSDKEEAWGRIKAYTGKQQVQIRQMRTDGFTIEHNATFMMTANRNPLLVDEDDRRLLLINTPNILGQEEWVADAGGTTVVMDGLEKETLDFCYYLATEVEELSRDEYMTPPESKHKRKLIAGSLPAAARLSYYFKQGMYEELNYTLDEYELHHIAQSWGEGRVYEDDIFDLYTMMTDGQGNKRSLSRVLVEAGFSKIPTTRDGSKAYYFEIPRLRGFVPLPIDREVTSL